MKRENRRVEGGVGVWRKSCRAPRKNLNFPRCHEIEMDDSNCRKKNAKRGVIFSVRLRLFRLVIGKLVLFIKDPKPMC